MLPPHLSYCPVALAYVAFYSYYRILVDGKRPYDTLLSSLLFIVLTNAYLPYPFVGVLGVPLVDLDGIKRFSSNPELTLISALRTWALSVADNDCFHADVHAGNLLVLEDGRVGFIDFGIGK